MDGVLQRILDVFNHRLLVNMTPDRRARKPAIVNHEGNTQTELEIAKSTPVNNFGALIFKRREGKDSEDMMRRQGNRGAVRNESYKTLSEAATEEVHKCKEEVKRSSSVPVEVESSQKGDLGDRESDALSPNFLTMPSLSVTNLLEEIEADLPSSYSLANVLDHTPHSVINLRTWARLSRVGTNCVYDEKNEVISENTESDHVNEMKNLQRESFIQKSLIEQADKALSLCKARKKNLDVEDLESARVLLMAKLRYEAINMELQRLALSTCGEQKEQNLGELEISDIWFTVNHSRVSKTDYFVCIVCHKEKLFASQFQNEVLNGELHFPVNFKFEHLRQNFIVYLELYRLHCGSKLTKELRVLDLKKLIQLMTHKRRENNGTMREPRNFECIGSGSLKLSDFRSREKGKVFIHFNAGCNSAFRRTVFLQLKTKVTLNSKMNGFLDLFKDRCWHRVWCSSAGHALQFWCYPEDKDNGKTPVESVLLPLCRENIQPVGLDVCIRPYSFMIPYKESERGILLSAGSRNDMIQWISFLRSAIRSFEAWALDL